MNDQLREQEEDQLKRELDKVMIIGATILFGAGMAVGIAATLLIQLFIF